MTDGMKIDVLICGAGACGLTLAIELARRGVAFRLIEKMPTPFAGSRGKGIQPRTLEIFEDLGILERVIAAGGPYPKQRIHHDDGSHAERDIAELASSTPAEPYRLPWMAAQFITERIMRERLNELGGQVEFGRELVAFEQHDQGVVARIAGPDGEETLHARYLVGADGGRSFVRKSLGIDFAGKTLDTRAIVADVDLAGLPRDAWHMFNHADMARMIAICPLAGTDLFQVQAPLAPDAPAELHAEGLNRMIAERTGRTDLIVRSVAWASDYRMNARLAARYRAGRVFLAGDAAHVHPPTGGQGLNTSVQDAYNLGWKLAAALRGARPDMLDSYERERRPVAEAVLGLSKRLLDEQKRGDMRRGREVQQLDIGYPGSPLLVQGARDTSPLQPGQRAPDAPVRGAAGQPSRLFEWFRGTHWTLLAHETTRELMRPRPGLRIHHIGSRGDLVDAWGHFRDAYGLREGECVLVRPDGYIAAVFRAEQAAEIDAWLAGMGVPAQ